MVAASLVPANERARAVGRMMLGLTGATLAGVPLATWLGQLFGWRAAYVLVGGIGVLTCVLISCCVPRTGPVEGASPARELSALSHKQLGAWLGGLAIARGLGWASTGWVGALLALGGLFIFGLSVAEESRCHLCKSSIHRISSGVSTPSISRL